jgi:hypothetical protein
MRFYRIHFSLELVKRHCVPQRRAGFHAGGGVFARPYMVEKRSSFAVLYRYVSTPKQSEQN